ncbi:hypothetical protein AYK24_07035 [Thermoplasmatales archaeon SG8-52-4]|nr:MAG: hypothetical protein AYK24_07035 [Thermoplasmatales archaeon SG8-52-4]
MKNTLFKKGLVVWIIILFVGVCFLSCVSSKDISISYNKILEDNNEIKSSDDYREIYTNINGWCWSIEEKRRSIFIHHDVELWGYANLNIKGIRFPFNFFDEYVDYVKVPCLLGRIIYDRSPLIVNGVAFGNIEWSEYK